MQLVGRAPVPSRCCWHGWKYHVQRCRTVPSRSGRRESRAGRGGHRGRLWPCGETHLGSAVHGGRWRGSPAGSRMCRSQEPSGLIEGGRTRTGGQRRKRETLLHQNAQCQSGRAGLATQERSATQQQSPHSSVATHSTVRPHAGAAWWSWSCERTERKRFFFPHQIVVMLGASRPSEQLAVENP